MNHVWKTRIWSGVLVCLIAGPALVPIQPALARDREKTWRIATYVGTAATIYALAKGKDTWALIGGGATLLSYNQWRNEMKRRHRRERSLRAYRAYRLNWLRRHKGRRIARVR